jgi:cyclopropane fatty-acyl-phospholipid synthase-like methyltransferase
MLPQPAYRHALELGCSVGVLTEALVARCDHVTATDIAVAALYETDARLRAAGRRQHVTLQRTSIDCAWPAADFDLVL